MQASPVSVVLVAGGKGLRMGNALPKQFLPLQGKPILCYAIQAFKEAFPNAQLILVLPEEQLSYSNMLLQSFEEPIELTIVSGGATRFHSVQNGLKAILPHSIVFVHDGVRPFIESQLLHTCYQKALETGTAIPVIPVTDSIRQLQEQASTALDRNQLKAVQTPQAFQSEIILKAFEQDYTELFTDEATVAEQAGFTLTLVEGSKQNIKITTPEDLLWAEFILQQAKQ